MRNQHMSSGMRARPRKLPNLILTLAIILITQSCMRPDPTFVLGNQTQSLLLNPSVEEIYRKVDFLFVVDNSGSMETSQSRLAQNFPVLLNKIISRKYDFRIAVTSTEAYRALLFPQEPEIRKLSHLRKTNEGEAYLTRETPNITQKFQQLVTIGINGSGDERPLLSVKAVLEDPENRVFRRNDAFLFIIIVSDEDDFSHLGYLPIENSFSSNLINLENLKSYFEGSIGKDQFSFNAITIKDSDCHRQLSDFFPDRKIGVRLKAISEMTDGIATSLCDDFANNLNLISDVIINRFPPITKYRLNLTPRVETIQVFINNQLIPNDQENGWVYYHEDLTIELKGLSSQAVQNGGEVKIIFTPLNPFAR